MANYRRFVQPKEPEPAAGPDAAIADDSKEVAVTTNNADGLGDAWDVITGTLDGGIVWRRYSDGRIVVTYGDENPQDVADREDENEGDDSERR